MKTKLNIKQTGIAAGLAAIVSAAINAVLFFIFKSANVFVVNVFIQPNEPLTIVQVVFSSIVPTLIASLVFFAFERFSNNGFRNFSILALVLLVASFVLPFMTIKDASISYHLALCLMHVVVTFSLLYFLSKSVKSNS